ncbi:MAG: cyclopropane-fatty-acyl-phospholipid synthase family protein [Sulfuricellaceae bacterium]|jgi:cyclopropane fatty-acyl-phospholipid synthase-like methyltransferase
MKDFWDGRYAIDDYFYGTAPNAFLAAQCHRLQSGCEVLAVADGEGRNGVWLAKQGLAVTAVDFSPVALEKARRLAEREGVEVRHELADLFAWDWGENRWDALVAIFVQFVSPEDRPEFHARMKRALKPGGLLLLQGYRPKQVEYGTGGPSSAANMYTAEMLREDFADLEILHLAEHDSVIEEGMGHKGLSALVDLVARKR